MSIVLNGTTGVTTPDVTSDSYTGALAVNASAPDNSVVVDADGNVGIGTSSPAKQLQIESLTGGTLRFSSSDTSIGAGESLGEIDWYSNDSSGSGTGVRAFVNVVENDSGLGRAYDMTFGTGNVATATEKMRLTKEGNLLVGTTSASVSTAHHLMQAGNELNLAGAAATSTIYFNYRAGTTLTALRFMNGSGSTSYVACYGTSFTNSSDYRIKTDVQEVGSVLEKVAQLRPLNYIKEGVIGREFGLIAHEAQAVFPDIVSGEKDAVDEDGDMEIQGIDYAQLSTILVKAIQEQQAIIEEQKTALEALTARVSALEASNV